MRAFQVFLKGMYIAATLMLVGSGPSRAEELKPKYLFKPVPQHKATSMPVETERKVAALRQNATTKSLWLAEIDLGLLEEKSLTFNVSTDTPMQAVTDRVQRRSENDFTWFGKITGASVPGEAILVVKDGQVTGTVQAGGEQYDIVPVSPGQHAILKVDLSKIPPDEGSNPMELQRLQEELKKEHKDVESASPRSENLPSEKSADGKYVMRVLLAYTPAAWSKAGGKEALERKIQLAVDSANQSYADSKVHVVLVPAIVLEVNYRETGNSWDEDLKRFRERGDNVMDEIHTLRDRHKADVAVLITAVAKNKNEAMCGIASAIGANAETAFCLVAQHCLTHHSLAHEIGHLQGARHNWETDPATDERFPHNHGFWHKGLHPSENWTTIMSYDCKPSRCARRPYWSNPNVTLAGTPTGSKDCCNNAAVLNATAKKICSFR